MKSKLVGAIQENSARPRMRPNAEPRTAKLVTSETSKSVRKSEPFIPFRKTS